MIEEEYWAVRRAPVLPVFSVPQTWAWEQSETGIGLVEYGWTSKTYPFGTINGAGGLLPTSVPSKMIVSSSFFAAPGESINIRVWNGSVSGPTHLYQTVLDTSNNINLLDQELPLSGFAPASLGAWQTIIKVSIKCSTSSTTSYATTEDVKVYVAKNRSSGIPSLSKTPIPLVTPGRLSGGVPTGNLAAFRFPPDPTQSNYVPLQGIQVQFFAKGTNHNLLTAVSDVNGTAGGKLPPGSYEVRPYGPGFTQNDWLTGNNSLAVGMSTTFSPFANDVTATSSDVNAAADFSYVKNMFASFKWVGYMIVEDFTSSRAAFRSDIADATDVFSALAFENFGRVYRGQSWVEFVAVGLDPAPQ